MLKFVIGDDRATGQQPDPDRPHARAAAAAVATGRTCSTTGSIFEVERGSAGGEIEWLINGQQFDPANVGTSLTNTAGKTPLAQQTKGSFNLWEIRNGGGGWVHPIHLHMEEHRTVMRNGKGVDLLPDAGSS